jgi:hypothetical protein
VSEFFGEDALSYEWVYVVPPERVDALVRALGGTSGDEVLILLAAYSKRKGDVEDILQSSEVAASFDNWVSYS